MIQKVNRGVAVEAPCYVRRYHHHAQHPLVAYDLLGTPSICSSGYAKQLRDDSAATDSICPNEARHLRGRLLPPGSSELLCSDDAWHSRRHDNLLSPHVQRRPSSLFLITPLLLFLSYRQLETRLVCCGLFVFDRVADAEKYSAQCHNKAH